jgi:hypothetical protein
MGSRLMDQVLADIILMIHALFVGFVVFGLVLIVAGLTFGWAWATNFCFRLVHLLAIALVVVQAWFNHLCPLTTWESRLRQAAGDAAYPGTFIQYWLQRLIFYDFAPWVFTAVYTAFGLLVLSTWILRPPRLPHRKEFSRQARQSSH